MPQGDAYIRTRARLLAGRLITDAQLESWLARLPDGLPPLPHGLSALETPVSGEDQLLRALIDDLLVLLRAHPPGERAVLLHWFRQFELRNLKTLLRGRLHALPAAQVRHQLLDLQPLGRLPEEELLRAEDTLELLRLLERTPYAGIARQARRLFQEEHDPFFVDAAVDRHYYAGFPLLLQRRERAGHPGPRQLLGRLLDKQNLLWLLRYRLVYGLTPAQTYFLLAPGGLLLRGARLLQLAGQESLDSALALLPEPLRSLLAGCADISSVEIRMEQHCRRLTARALRECGDPLTRSLACLMLEEARIRQTRALLTGARLHQPVAAIRRAMSLPLPA
jgi:V/A-type H+-transporting ATPase subunit C